MDCENLNKIKEILITQYSLEVNYELTTQVCLKNDLIVATIVAPHDGTKYKWLLRMSTASGFDRWANSCAIEEFFATHEEVIQYLNNNEVNIYKQLLQYLSREYDEIHN